MIRAVFFDFYSVWTPDKLAYYLAMSQQVGPEVYKQLSDVVENYYQGHITIEQVTENFRMRLGQTDISPDQFLLSEAAISPEIVNFMRRMHSHFVKLGVLANLGTQEYKILNDFNEHNQLFEVIASPLSFKIVAPLHSKEVFAAALQAIGEPPDSCLLVSGNLEFLEFAANLGLQVMQFEGLPKLEVELEQLISNETPQ